MIEHSQKIAALIYKYLQGELSAAEKTALDQWIAESEENAASFKQLTDKGIYEQVKKDFDDARLVAAAERISRRVGFEVKPYVQGGHKAKLRRMAWMKYAAAAAVLLLAVAGIWVYKSRQPTTGVLIAKEQPADIRDIRPWGDKAEQVLNNGSRTVSTPRAGKHQLILPDGSRVWLNADSKISFPAVFATHERKVQVEGEAYFEVAKNKSAPFLVALMDDARVTVLGTHFNVRSYKGEELTTSLLEGKVSLAKGNASVTLEPGQQATIGSNNKIDTKPVADGAVSWRDGTLSLAGADIQAFMNAVSRTYNIDIHVEKDAVFRAFSFTGPVPMTLTIGGLLQELEKAEYRISARLTGDTIFIKPK